MAGECKAGLKKIRDTSLFPMLNEKEKKNDEQPSDK